MRLNKFQSTRPVRARHNIQPEFTLMSHFNPRAPCGRDAGCIGVVRPIIRFQSTRPVRARLGVLMAFIAVSIFQSTRPVRARLTGNRYLSMDEIFQSTRPVRARPDYEGVNFWQSIISIHAPRAGATVYKIILHTFATKGNS